jgi:hypothetical protein
LVIPVFWVNNILLALHPTEAVHGPVCISNEIEPKITTKLTGKHQKLIMANTRPKPQKQRLGAAHFLDLTGRGPYNAHPFLTWQIKPAKKLAVTCSFTTIFWSFK